MPAAREMLEGEAYWGRIRSIKHRLFLLEAILVAILGIIFIFIYSNFQTNPFFISIDRLIWFVLIMLLIIELESFVFRTMQIHIARTFSTKHLMTTNSIRKALVIIIIAALALVAFALPSSVQSIEDAYSVQGDVSPTMPVKFLPGDPLGLSRIKTITFHVPVPAEIYIVSKYDFEHYSGNWASLRGAALNVNKSFASDTTIPLLVSTHEELYIMVDPTISDAGEMTTVTYRLNSNLSSTLTAFVPLMAIFFLIANGVWVMYLFPMSRKYACRSIYK